MAAPSLVAIVAAISNQVALRLDAAGYPPLADGRILMGRQAQYAQHSPPRIIMTPTDSSFGGPAAYSRDPRGAEAREQKAHRPIATEMVRFEVQCWGASLSEDAEEIRDDDFDVTRALYHAVLEACSCPPLDAPDGPAVLGPLTSGGVEAEPGKWIDATFAASQNVVLGRAFTFGLRLATPVLDRLYPYAPSDVRANPKTYLKASDGQTDQGCGDGT